MNTDAREIESAHAWQTGAAALHGVRRRCSIRRANSAAHCLADTLEWRVSDDAPGEVLATTPCCTTATNRRSGAMLPMRVGLVRLDAGPTAVCFLAEDCSAGTRVRVTARLDGEGRAVLSASAATASFAAVTKGVS